MINQRHVPFTITADLDLAGRVTPYIDDLSPDVRIFEDEFPNALKNPKSSNPFYEAGDGQFLVKVSNGLRFLIEDGKSIRYSRPSDVSNREVLLFLLGSAWGALSYQRGLLPIHASAVIKDGRVYAFSGQSGAGKSTLTAALSQSGHEFFSDDVLIIDPSSFGDKAVCYAGQKDLKLWGNALKLINIDGKHQVRDDESFDKFYADPARYSDKTVGVLEEVYLLTSREPQPNASKCTVTPIRGAKIIPRFNNTIYRYWYGFEIVGQKTLFQWLAELIQHVNLLEYDRPFHALSFPYSVEFISEHLAAKYKMAAE